MKQLLLLALACYALSGCGSPPATTEAKTDTTAKKEALVYPVKAKYGINWQPGDEKFAVMALNSYKSWIDSNTKASVADFADSFEFNADKFHFKGTKDSVLSMFLSQRAMYAAMSINVDTWLTTYYPDYNTTWVTIWSTEYYTDKKGKSDSVYLVDDVQIKDGKIQQIDEKQRMFPPPMTAKK